MANKFFCRECGGAVIWGERKRRWTHAKKSDDHDVILAKTNGPFSEGEGVPDEVLVDRSDMIGEPLDGLNNIGTVGTLDGQHDESLTHREWIDLRYLIDRAWTQIGGKYGLVE